MCVYRLANKSGSHTFLLGLHHNIDIVARNLLQENLRQLCVYRLANESGKPWVWWDYITRFGSVCSMHDRTYNQDCAEKVLMNLNCNQEHWVLNRVVHARPHLQ